VVCGCEEGGGEDGACRGRRATCPAEEQVAVAAMGAPQCGGRSSTGGKAESAEAMAAPLGVALLACYLTDMADMLDQGDLQPCFKVWGPAAGAGRPGRLSEACAWCPSGAGSLT